MDLIAVKSLHFDRLPTEDTVFYLPVIIYKAKSLVMERLF